MKFSIQVSDIRKAVSIVRDVVPTRSVSQESSGILIECAESSAIFTAVGSDTVVRVSFPVVCIEPGRVCVSSSLFSNTINAFSAADGSGIGTKDVVIEADVRARSVVITAKTKYPSGKTVRNKRSVPLLNSELFPSIPKVPENSNLITLWALSLLEALGRTVHTVSVNTSDGPLAGLYLKLSGNTALAVATDGLRLSEYTSSIDTDRELEVVIPSRFAMKLCKCLNPETSVNLSASRSMLWASSENLIVGGVLINSVYPNYKSFLGAPELTASIDRFVFLDNIRNLDTGVSTDERIVLSFADKALTIRTDSAENTSIECDFSGSLELSFNIKQLRATLQSFVGASLQIGFSGPSRPVFFKCEDEFSDSRCFTSVLMPMNN